MEASSAEGLRRYQQALLEFQSKHKDDAPGELGEAARLAGRLSEAVAEKSIKVSLRTLGDLSKGNEGYLGLRVLCGKMNEKTYDEDLSKERVTTLSFDQDKEFSLPWEPNAPIILQVRLDWGYRWREKIVGEKRLEGLLSIAQMDGEIIMENRHKDSRYFDDERIVLTADVLGWQPHDWELLDRWVFGKQGLRDLVENQ